MFHSTETWFEGIIIKFGARGSRFRKPRGGGKEEGGTISTALRGEGELIVKSNDDKGIDWEN